MDLASLFIVHTLINPVILMDVSVHTKKMSEFWFTTSLRILVTGSGTFRATLQRAYLTPDIGFFRWGPFLQLLLPSSFFHCWLALYLVSLSNACSVKRLREGWGRCSPPMLLTIGITGLGGGGGRFLYPRSRPSMLLVKDSQWL